MDNYFYSGQVRRYLQQFIRLMNNFYVRLGNSREGNSRFLRVPVYYGDSSRQVSSIILRNSENTLNAVPAMSIYINGLKYDRARVQEPFHVSKSQIRQRAYDPVTGQLSSLQGDLITVERLMPVPYLLSVKLDIWTSNTDQKLQLLEQIAVLFNPSLEVQSSDQYLDWGSLSIITLVDQNWSSRTIPSGSEDSIDVHTMGFELPIWLGTPAKVKKMGVIQKIIGSIYESNGSIDDDLGTFSYDLSTLASRRIITPTDYNLLYLGNTLQILRNDNNQEFRPNSDYTIKNNNVANWRTVINNYGELESANASILTNGISSIYLDNDGITLAGTVSYHPTNSSLLIFNLDTDTIPVDTLSALTGIIDPQTVTVTSALTTPPAGARYLIVNPIGSAGDASPATLWHRAGYPALIADTNDIIEWTGTNWIRSFDASTVTAIQYVTNSATGVQYKWKNNQWNQSTQGLYGVGAWRLVL